MPHLEPGDKERRMKHGHSQRGKMSAAYHSWQDMIRRCTNPDCKDYINYGGRGITVCEHWKIFTNFLYDMGDAPDRCQLDRIYNNKGYYKDNCRWATKKEQARNRRNNNLITAFGKTKCLVEWSEATGITWTTLYARIYKYNWSVMDALTIRVRNGGVSDV